MSKPIFEEEGKAPAAGMATAQQKIEKQARQLAYDTRYQVKKEIGDKKVNPAAMKRLLMQRLQKSTAAPNVKVRAKQMLLGEDYIGDVADFAAGTVANALFKVFVEGTQQEVSEEIELQYLKELEEKKERKYKVRVTDKKTGNSYVRYATREKITQLRTNPNIQSVEMTEYGEPREGERKSGEQTAKATAGKGLDPVGKEDKDIDNDGDHDKTDKYLLNRRKVRGQAIAKRKGVAEEFLADAATEDSNDKKITGKGVNNYSGKNPAVKIMPEDPTSQTVRGPRSVYAHYEPEGEVIAEKAVSKAQQKFMGMVYAVKKGAKPMSKEVAQAAAGMSKKEAKKFAKTKHEGLPTHKEAVEPSGGGKSPQLPSGVIKAVDELPQKVKTIFSGLSGAKVRPTQTTTIRKEEKECGCEEEPKSSKKGEMDVRELPTKMNMVKNKMRAMGLKMSYEPEGEQIDEIAPIAIGAGMAAAAAAPYLLKKFAKPAVDKAIDSQATGSGGLIDQMKQRRDVINQKNSYEPEGEVIDERRREDRGKPRGPEPSAAFKAVSKMMGAGRLGVQPRGEKKEPGKKPPAAGEYGGPESPAQKVAKRRAAAQRAKEMQSSRFD